MKSVLNWNFAIMLHGALWELWSPEGVYLKTQTFAWPCFYKMHGYKVNAQLFIWVLRKFKNVGKSQRRPMTWPTTHYYLTAFSLTWSVKRRSIGSSLFTRKNRYFQLPCESDLKTTQQNPNKTLNRCLSLPYFGDLELLITTSELKSSHNHSAL